MFVSVDTGVKPMLETDKKIEKLGKLLILLTIILIPTLYTPLTLLRECVILKLKSKGPNWQFAH